MHAEPEFKGFEHPVQDIIKFLAAHDFFTIMLRNGKIIHYSPEDYHLFLKWLKKHQVPDIRENWRTG